MSQATTPFSRRSPAASDVGLTPWSTNRSATATRGPAVSSSSPPSSTSVSQLLRRNKDVFEPEVHFLGEIVGAKLSDANVDNAFCSFEVQTGSSWECVGGAMQGQTHVDYPLVFDIHTHTHTYKRTLNTHTHTLTHTLSRTTHTQHTHARCHLFLLVVVLFPLACTPFCLSVRLVLSGRVIGLAFPFLTFLLFSCSVISTGPTIWWCGAIRLISISSRNRSRDGRA